jgi:phage shock protein A
VITSHEKTIAILQEQLKQSEQTKLELKQTIQDQQKQISELQTQLKDIAVQGVRKSTTTNILKLESLTDEWLSKQAALLIHQ